MAADVTMSREEGRTEGMSTALRRGAIRASDSSGDISPLARSLARSRSDSVPRTCRSRSGTPPSAPVDEMETTLVILAFLSFATPAPNR